MKTSFPEFSIANLYSPGLRKNLQEGGAKILLIDTLICIGTARQGLQFGFIARRVAGAIHI